MSFNTRLLENINIVSAFPMQDINTDATGDWVSLKNYEGCLLVIHKNAGTAGDDMTITLNQAVDVAGTSSKALTFSHIYAKVGATALTATGTFTKYTGTAVSTLDTVTAFGTDLTADANESMLIIDIRTSNLDVDGGFDCIQFTTEGDDIANAVYCGAWYLLYGARFPQATPLTAIVD